MTKNKKKLNRQKFLLFVLLIVFVASGAMIYLGATIFRSQIPFFQLIDGDPTVAMPSGPKPPTNPGVIEVEEEAGVRLYMVLGSDYRPQSGFRTDILMLVALEPRSGKVSLVSFPRDLWVDIPGYGQERINTVMQTGGFPLLADTMQTNFGVYPTQYAMIDMAGFLDVIDVLGGIEVETENYTGDACETDLDPDRWCEVFPGTVSMNSQWALWYVRARYNSSDFDRMRRTQEVVQAVAKKAMSPAGLLKTTALMDIYESEVESNVSPDQVLPLARLGLGFDINEDVRRFSVGPEAVSSWTTANGGAVLLPNVPAIQAILAEALTFD